MNIITKDTNEKLEADLIDFRVMFAYHSNKIENSKTDYYHIRDIFENGKVVSYTGDIKTLFEMSNQKDCYEFMLPKILKGEKLTIELIHKIHYELTKGTYDEIRYLKHQERPGQFKKHDYVTGIHEVGSHPEDVHKQLSTLLEKVNEYSGDDVLTVAAYFHAMFENIHPYADGNGRVGRTLLNYYLMTHGIKPIIIYDEDKALYYECLESFDIKDDLKSLIKFLKYEQEKTWIKKHHVKEKGLDYFL